jgi:hypothetical protein
VASETTTLPDHTTIDPATTTVVTTTDLTTAGTTTTDKLTTETTSITEIQLLIKVTLLNNIQNLIIYQHDDILYPYISTNSNY